MRKTKMTIFTLLALGLTTCAAQRVAGQSDQPSAATSQETTSAIAVTDQPFSGIKYERTVKNMPDGKQVVEARRYSVLLARDTDGRVLIEGDNPTRGCDELGLLEPSKCQAVGFALFDPMARTIAYWLEGEIAGGGTEVSLLSESQFDEAERLTLNVQRDANEGADEESNVTRKDLGQKEIEGVSATGVRWTTVVPPASPGKKATITHIHEVWMSTEMKMIVKVIDGDPLGEETISGLEHISQTPDPSLFIPHPRDPLYVHYHKNESELADAHLRYLIEWQVQ